MPPLPLRYILIGLVCWCWDSPCAVAQLNFRAGTLVYFDANIYQWYKRPAAAPLGQPANILPAVTVGAWVGVPRHWMAIGEGMVHFFPYSFNINKPQSFGALSLTAMGKTIFPLSDKHGLCPYLSVGLGVQWNKVGLYAAASNTPFFETYIAEVDAGLGSGWGSGDATTRVLGFFLRGGLSPKGGVSIDIGFRVGNLFGTKDNQQPIKVLPPQEPTFQTR